MTLPERMRCIVVREPGGPEVLALSEAPLPVPRADEILIRVQAAGVGADGAGAHHCDPGPHRFPSRLVGGA